MRKLTALFLSALMLIGMCTPAFAAVELEDAPFTTEELTKINEPRTVLEKYGTLRIDEQMMTAGGEQTVVDYSVSNGALILVVSTPDPADENARTVTDMFAEAESGLITNKNAVTYVASDGGEVESGCSHYVYQYGMPYDPEFDETVSEGGAASFCALTLVINPSQSNEETQQHNVALGLEVQFTALEGENVAIYADEAMTQAVDTIDTSAESATYYISVG